MNESEQALDLVQIERLAEKVKGLIDQLEQSRAALAQADAQNAALQREVEELREHAASTGAAQAAETERLLAEREQIRERVQRMLQQIETIGASLEDQEAFAQR